MKKNTKANVVKGAGIAAGALAAVAGAYFLYGTKQGKKVKKKIKSFAIKAKGEVLEKLEKAKDLTEDSYKDIVVNVMKKYEKLKNEHGEEIEAVTKELMNHWKALASHASPKAKGKAKKFAKKSK